MGGAGNGAPTDRISWNKLVEAPGVAGSRGDAALHAPDAGGTRRGHPAIGWRGNSWRNRGGAGKTGLASPVLLRKLVEAPGFELRNVVQVNKLRALTVYQSHETHRIARTRYISGTRFWVSPPLQRPSHPGPRRGGATESIVSIRIAKCDSHIQAVAGSARTRSSSDPWVGEQVHGVPQL